MKRLVLLFFLFLTVYAALLLSNPSRSEYYVTLAHSPARTIWVGSNGWHTGIIVRMADIPQEMLPEKADFAGEEYLEMGWGDAGFYQAEDITTSLIFQALFLSTPSIVHLAGFSKPPKDYFIASRMTALPVTEKGFHALLAFMHGSIERRGHFSALPKRKGLYGNSRFYEGTGSYHLFHTCNHWAAQALNHAGVPLTPWYAATTGALMWQLERYRLMDDAV